MIRSGRDILWTVLAGLEELLVDLRRKISIGEDVAKVEARRVRESAQGAEGEAIQREEESRMEETHLMPDLALAHAPEQALADDVAVESPFARVARLMAIGR